MKTTATAIALSLVLVASACQPTTVLPGEQTPPCTPSYRTYRIDRVDMSDLNNVLLDLDHNGYGDNQAGFLLSLLMYGFPSAENNLPVSVQTALTDDSQVVWLVQVGACGAGATSYVSAVTFRGQDRDGDGVYEPVRGDTVPAVGERRGNHLVANDGVGALPLSVFADVYGDHPVQWMDGDGLTLDLKENTDGTLSGLLGLAEGGDYRGLLAEPLADFFTERLRAGTLVNTASMDANHDGLITPFEFLIWADEWLQEDVDLFDADGNYAPNSDRQRDRFSVVLPIHAEPVTVEK